MATPVTVTLTAEALRNSWEQFFRKYQRQAVNAVALVYPEQRSIVIPYGQLARHDDQLADFTLQHPLDSLDAAQAALAQIEKPVEEPLKLFVRIEKLPEIWRIPLRELRAEHLGRLISCSGLIKRSSEVRPRLKVGAFECLRCGGVTNLVQEDQLIFAEPAECPQCEKRSTFRFLDDQSQYVDTQRLEIQEMPEGLRGGEQPQRIHAYAEVDLCGRVAPGDRVTFNGILRSQQRRVQGQPSTLFDVFLDINSIEMQEQEFEEVQISPQELEEILAFSQDPEIYSKLEKSLAPSIARLDMEKRALMLQLFGGVPKKLPDGARIRGDIHVLLVGDPGVAKSQLLRYASRLAPRSVYTSGKSSSAAGLTAAAVRDEAADGRWTLEAGALVLADLGLCAIDEIDKMDPKDQSAMHEAMEQQTVSVAKAGITAELQSRCSILGAANPKWSRFDSNKPLSEQITLTPALLSRFDVIFTLTDKPDTNRDGELAEHILRVHRAGAIGEYRRHNDEGLYTAEDEELAGRVIEPPVNREFMRKYVAHAKRSCFPVLTPLAHGFLKEYYVRIRREAAGEDQGPVPLTARQLEALVRLTEASARIRLSNEADVVDAQRAIEIVEYWLTKLSGGQGLMDIDRAITGIGHSQRERLRIVLEIVRRLAASHQHGASLDEIVDQASQQGVAAHDVESTLDMLKRQGTLWSPSAPDRFKLVQE